MSYFFGATCNCPPTAVGVPAQIPDLQYWFEADIGAANSTAGLVIPALQNSNPVSSYSPVQVNAGAIRNATNLNGKSVVDFAGSAANAYLFAGGGFLLGLVTTFVVFNPAAVGYGTFFAGPASSCLEATINPSLELELDLNGVATIGASTSAFTIGKWSQANATYNSGTGTYAFRFARAAAGSGTNPRTISSSTTSVGYNPSGSGGQYLNGVLGEIIIYNRVLTALQITAVENYLKTKWGV